MKSADSTYRIAYAAVASLATFVGTFSLTTLILGWLS